MTAALAPRMNAANTEVQSTARMSVGALAFRTGSLWCRYSSYGEGSAA